MQPEISPLTQNPPVALHVSHREPLGFPIWAVRAITVVSSPHSEATDAMLQD